MGACSFCGARQPFLHLRTEKPCFVRCGRCGARGPKSETPDEAVRAWNEHVDDVANGGFGRAEEEMKKFHFALDTEGGDMIHCEAKS